MPVVDMPIEELKKYRGMSPCPDDFDEFWDRSLAEMREIDPKTELVRADFYTNAADCYDLYFTSTKNSRIHAKLLIPKNLSGKAPALMYFHGYSVASEQWTYYLPYAASGFIVAALDCRGQGGLSEDGGNYLGSTQSGFVMRGIMGKPEDMYYRNVFLDTAKLADIVMGMDQVDETRVGVFGGSQGGALSLVCAALVPEIKHAEIKFPFLCDFKRVWSSDLDTNAYPDIKEFFRKYDPMHQKEDEYFVKLGYIDVQNFAHRIKADVTMYTGLMDNVCPPSSQFAAYNKIESSKKLLVFPDFGHETFFISDDLFYQNLMKRFMGKN